MTLHFDTREQWLMAAVQECTPRFEAKGFTVPANIKVSCGWPVGSRGGKKVLGQCWHPKASAGGWIEVFISPLISDPLTALGILMHEKVHAVVGNEAGHGPEFKRCADAIGLVGKATQCLPGGELNEWLTSEVLPMLGDYPHDALDPGNRKKQSTRLIKVICPVSGYTARITEKWLAMGTPTSPAGVKMVVER